MLKRSFFLTFTLLAATFGAIAQQQSITIAVVNNPDMIRLKRLASKFEEKNPNIRVNWVVVEENILRQRVTTDVSQGSGQFDLVYLGLYEAPIFAKRGWLRPIENLPAEYDLEDVFKSLRDGLSYEGKLYALPFNGESSMLMYRKDLLVAKGLKMPEQPTYDDITKFASALTDKGAGIAGGKAAMWIDATSGAGPLYDKAQSQVADKVAFAPAPIAVTPNGSHWLWSWALAIPKSAKHPEAALQFASWATSKEYIKLAAEDGGWAIVPPGTRKSTYDNPEYQNAAPFAAVTLKAMQTADPTNPAIRKVPYIGIQFVGIPEFQSIGTQVGQNLSGALAGKTTVDQALEASQSEAERAVKQAGYLK
jgi:ABC-type glycerol-3-phosphate transport system substrate-binding protein